MISYPAKLKPKKAAQLINSIDILPTLLELAGIEIPEVIDGNSYADYMNGKEKETTDKIFFQFDRGVLNDNGPDRYYRAVRTKRYTYVAAMSPYYDQFVGKNKEVLYDNEKDPYQLHPIFLGEKYDAIMNELRTAVMDWCEQTHDPFLVNTGNDRLITLKHRGFIHEKSNDMVYSICLDKHCVCPETDINGEFRSFTGQRYNSYSVRGVAAS